MAVPLDQIVNYNAERVWEGILLDAPTTTVAAIGRAANNLPVAIANIQRFPSHVVAAVDLSQDDTTAVATGSGVISLNEVFTTALTGTPGESLGVEFIGTSGDANPILPDQIPSWSRREATVVESTPQDVITFPIEFGVAPADWFTYRICNNSTSATPLDPATPADPTEISQYQADRSRPLAVRTYTPPVMTLVSMEETDENQYTIELNNGTFSPDVAVANGVMYMQPLSADGPLGAYIQATGSDIFESAATYTLVVDVSAWPESNIALLTGFNVYWQYDVPPYVAAVDSVDSITPDFFTDNTVPAINVKTRPVVTPITLATERIHLIGIIMADVVADGETPVNSIEYDNANLPAYP